MELVFPTAEPTPDRAALAAMPPKAALQAVLGGELRQAGQRRAAFSVSPKGRAIRAEISNGQIEDTDLAKWIETAFRISDAEALLLPGFDTPLTRADWLRETELRIKTPRTVLRPFDESDSQAFREIAGDLEVARMMINIAHPLSEKAAAKWIRQRRYRGRPGFFLAIEVEGQLAGSIGFGALNNSLAYFLARSHWGRGLAGEIVPGFVADVIPRFALPAMFAGVFTDNPASLRILEKTGFRETTRTDFRSPARTEAQQIIEMALTPETAPDRFAPIRLSNGARSPR
ncbi:GNAT family N-acetyltransferase [Tropicimonas sp. TH_r6]|uniref:GNAT family N-acetyltransferase n=1 Tax=Tropicimonas sp. TH_r6 TaxID=3082085 RepID=UPI0029533682|nr:GNAT family N-acetyltransferase [Tropicimonas sp. TH_r6]MDV7141316.1 GNAT family N-acetyltransferase [Tropicimonas sp. TH_r6]